MAVKIGLVKHPNVNDVYAFSVPAGEELQPGNYILCNTRLGEDQIGRCVSPAFWVEEDKLFEFYGTTEKKLQPVTSMLIPFRYEDKKVGEENAEESENG